MDRERVVSKLMERFAIAHLSLPIREIDDIIAQVAEAVMETRQMIPPYISDHPEFRETGETMVSVWEEGVKDFVRTPH